MALRARLVAPPPAPAQLWPYHKLKSASVPASLLLAGDRRMEAETYLSSGFGIRAAIEARASGWVPFADLAAVWMPSRLKGIQVARDVGTPFLAATQVFDVRPIPRKWLALHRTSDAQSRFVSEGMILVTCSGSVGRPTLAYAPHENTLISHDLLRIEAKDEHQWGWLYAYLHTSQCRAMAIGAHYGHIIKHLETSHIETLPVPIIPDDLAKEFSVLAKRIIALRNEGYHLTLEAEAQFERVFGPIEIKDSGERGFEVRASRTFLSGRRRLDAATHNPGVSAIRRHLSKSAIGFTKIRDAGYQVWVPGRYKRVPADDGVIYRDSADLLEVSPVLTKRYADCRFGDEHHGRVQSGWILVPCSGQVYGIIGTPVLASAALQNQVVSNHVIRVAPSSETSLHPGYLLTALSHPVLGRPVVKALAFGSSVPEIAPDDLSEIEVARADAAVEETIAQLAAMASARRAEADLLEAEAAARADAILTRFVQGHGVT